MSARGSLLLVFLCPALLGCVQISDEENYAHAPILAWPILGPGSVHVPSWPRQDGVCTDPGLRVGLARIGVCA
eukprot:7780390-Pyramimonas_sp.AAC.1